MRRKSMEDARGSLGTMSTVTCLFGAAFGLYAVVSAVAVCAAGQVQVQLGFGDYTAPMHPVEPRLPAGVGFTPPYQVMVPRTLVPLGAEVALKAAAALTPLLWAVVVELVGLVGLHASGARAGLDTGVLRRVGWLRNALVVLALLPTGLRILGSEWLTRALHLPAGPWSSGADTWVPMFAALLCIAFELIIRRAVELQDELDEVI